MQEKMHNNPTVHLALGILIVLGVIALIISIVSALLTGGAPLFVAVLILLSFLRRRMYAPFMRYSVSSSSVPDDR